MHKLIRFITAGFLVFALLLPTFVLAEDHDTDTSEETGRTGVDFKSQCEVIKADLDSKYAPCATSVAECGTDASSKPPINCIFLSEPIGGDYNYDLYKVSCGVQSDTNQYECRYNPYSGEALVGGEYVVQALLTYREGAEREGPFTLLYSYLGLVYNFMTGIIIAFVILIIIIAGVILTTSGGDQDKVTSAKDMIRKALIGMALWFTASLILYSINPTFFAF